MVYLRNKQMTAMISHTAQWLKEMTLVSDSPSLSGTLCLVRSLSGLCLCSSPLGNGVTPACAKKLSWAWKVHTVHFELYPRVKQNLLFTVVDIALIGHFCSKEHPHPQHTRARTHTSTPPHTHTGKYQKSVKWSTGCPNIPPGLACPDASLPWPFFPRLDIICYPDAFHGPRRPRVVSITVALWV